MAVNDDDEPETYPTAGEYMTGQPCAPQKLDCTCVECGKHFTECTGHGHSETPAPGDVTVCWNCGCIMEIAQDGVFRADAEKIRQAKQTIGIGGMLKFQLATGKRIH